MTKLSEDVEIDVSDEVNTSDFVRRASRHSWKISFRFPNRKRDPFDTPSGKKYGTGVSFAKLYKVLKSDFIGAYFESVYPDSDVKGKGDELIASINAEVGIVVDNISTTSGELFKIAKNVNVNYKRFKNAEQRLSEQLERLEAMESEISSLESNLKLTKSGTYDRRTANYKQYVRALDELDRLRASTGKLEESQEREQRRYESSFEKEERAVTNLEKIKSGAWEQMGSKYLESARDFASEIKEDILRNARNGTLPFQDLGLMESTIKKRLSVGLSAMPRFWATHQLIESVIITCTLV